MHRRLLIRDGDPPADGVVMIRAGIMTPESVWRTATDSFEEFGAHLVSVEAVLDGTVAQTCRRSPRIGDRYGKVRLSTAGRLRGAGFALLATFGLPHFDVALPDLSDDAIKRLDACFDDPVRNPARHFRGKVRP